MFQSTTAVPPARDRVVAGGLTATLAVALLAMASASEPPPPADPIIEPAPLVELVSTPRPPPAGGGGSVSPPPKKPAAPRATAPPVPPPVEPPPEAPPPEPAVADLTPADAGNTRGTLPASGPGTGEGSGAGPGTGPGPGGPGVGPGGDGNGPVALPGNAVRARRKVEPVYPRAAHDLKLPEARCRARITIDTKGKPTDVSVTGCATVFHAATVRAMMQWRFYPARVDGKKVSASFVVPIRFRP